MVGEWVSASEGRILLGCSERVVRLTASRMGWRTRTERGNGGERKLFHRADVLAYKARRDGTPTLSLVTSDPTPEVPAEISADGAWLSVSERGRRVAAQRLQVVEAFDAWRRAGSGTSRGRAGRQRDRSDASEFTADWNRARPDFQVTVSTLYRWSRDHKSGGIAGLVPGHCTRSQGGPGIPEELRAHFDGLYLTQAKATVRTCVRMTALYAAQHDIPMPSMATWYRYEESIPEHTRVLKREGEKAWYDKCGVHARRDTGAIYSNDFWVADHHQVDVAVRGPDGRPCFPWVTMFMDERTRTYVGWYVSVTPNSDTIFAAFRRACRRFGLPRGLHLDNGKDFRSVDFAGGRRRTIHVATDPVRAAGLAARLDLEVIWAKPYNARSKPIERSFLTLKEWFSKLWPSYRGGNVLEKPEGLRKLLGRPEDLPTLEQFDQLFEDWVTYDYNASAMDAADMPKGLARIDAWKKFLPETGMRTARDEDLTLLCMRTTRPMRVRPNGIRMWGFDFAPTTDALFSYLKQKVFVRYDVAEPGRLWLFDLEDRFIATAECRPLLDWRLKGEDIRAVLSERKRTRALAGAYNQDAARRAAEPDELKRYIDGRRAAAAGGPPADDDMGRVIAPVQWQRAAVGCDVIPGGGVSEAEVREAMGVLNVQLAKRLREITHT